MKKKITAILICFLLISCSLPLCSAASETETDTSEAISGSISTESTAANIRFEIFISSTIVSATIAVIGNIVTTKMANKAARKTALETANREIEKMERTWQREDLVSSDEEFAKMASAVASFVYYGSGHMQVEALQEIASIRSKEGGTLAKILDTLYVYVKDDQHESADATLSKAIEEKRRIKSGTSACK